MLGEKLAITSKKPQTTRNRILGVLHRAKAQLVFMDTPGIHRTRGALNARIVDMALAALKEADVVLLVADAAKPDDQAESFLLRQLAQIQTPIVLALNKIDQMTPDTSLAGIAAWSPRADFKHIVPISARRGTQVDVLIERLEQLLPAGSPFFPEDTLTDLPERFVVAELVREKVFRLTGEEIPYAAAVTIDTFKEPAREGAPIRIQATIHVERQSQKGIVIGRGGLKLKQIGQAAREDIEHLLAARVYLELFVRVQPNWRRDTRALRKFGY
jgi:GTP-binding protein Era